MVQACFNINTKIERNKLIKEDFQKELARHLPSDEALEINMDIN